jgi:hypothetical protein
LTDDYNPENETWYNLAILLSTIKYTYALNIVANNLSVFKVVKSLISASH